MKPTLDELDKYMTQNELGLLSVREMGLCDIAELYKIKEYIDNKLSEKKYKISLDNM